MVRRFRLEEEDSPVDVVELLIHDVNPSQLSGASHRSSEALLREALLREALLDARRDTVTHRATMELERDRWT